MESTRRPEGPKGSPKGRRLEVGDRRAPKLLLHYIIRLYCTIALHYYIACLCCSSRRRLISLPVSAQRSWVAIHCTVEQYYTVLQYFKLHCLKISTCLGRPVSWHLPPASLTRDPLPSSKPFPLLPPFTHPFNVFSSSPLQHAMHTFRLSIYLL